MGKIKILSKDVANIIAAGEVVENPASLVKELVENSIDAEATFVEVYVNNDCRNIKVKDNGLGMSLEDLELSIKRHSTSKIFEKEDLFNLKTLGFRGEALASIASVSRMSIASNDGTQGHKIYVESDIVGEEIIAINRGTEIEIEDLFYNVPARLKFMKTTQNEYSKIKNMIIKLALSNYNISFALYFDDDLKLKTSGKGVENTILELFGLNTLQNLNKFNLGYLGNSSIGRASNDMIFTFFNGRYAKAAVVDKAIIDAYHTRLDKGKYPFVIIFFEINPNDVDVNVHPSKKVIKFTNERAVYQVINSNINKALDYMDRNIVSPIIKENSFKFTAENINEQPINREANKIELSKFQPNKFDPSKFEPTKFEPFKFEPSKFESNQIQSDTALENLAEEREKLNQKIMDSKAEDYFIKNKFVGQIFRSFSVVDCIDRIEIYDNHIVQERILYEEIKEKYYAKAVIKQQLLIPIKIKINKQDKEHLFLNEEFLSEFGFEIEDFGDADVVIRAVPLFNFFDSIESIFKDLVHLINSNPKDIREETIITMSCRKSIKAGDNVSNDEIKSLINKLHKLGKYTCPHGRNIILELSRSFIEKNFKR